MKVDLDRIAKQVAEQRARRAMESRGSGNGGGAVRCQATEARVLGAVLAERGVLAKCDDVEVDDFTDPRFRLLFGALRNVLSRRSGTTPEPSVLVDETMAYLAKHDYLGITWFDVGDVIAGTTNYGGRDTVQLAHDLSWLRTLNLRRRSM